MESYDLFTDYFELSRMISKSGNSLFPDERRLDSCISSVSQDLMEMDDQSQDSVFFNEEFPLMNESTLNNDSQTQKPLWMNFDNGDVFYSHNGTMPDCLNKCNIPEKNLETGFQDFTIPLSPFSRKRKLSNGATRSQSRSSSLSNVSSDVEPVASLLYVLQDLINDRQNSLMESGVEGAQRRLFAVDEKACVLCKKNGETKEFYTTHVLKDNRGKVICPILRKYVCPKCGARGDNAHTLRHCPITKATEETGVTSTIIKTVQTPRSSCGRRRKSLW